MGVGLLEFSLENSLIENSIKLSVGKRKTRKKENEEKSSFSSLDSAKTDKIIMSPFLFMVIIRATRLETH